MSLPRIILAGEESPQPTVRWTVQGTTIDYTFYPYARPLSELLAEAGCDELVPLGSGLLAFGNYDVSEGGGAEPWLVDRSSDGTVFEFDAEREEPLVPLNSTFEAFRATFDFFDAFLRLGQAAPLNVEDALRSLDPLAFQKSEWRSFAKFVRAHMTNGK
jgi:hypothetical protein